MSDSITIKELLDLNESIFTKMSDITLEATVKQVGQAYERKVKSGKREGELFYSQKLTVNDNTGAIVVDYIANKPEQTIPGTAIGLKVRIEDAKTDIYKDERRLARGKVTLLESAKQPSGGNGYDTLSDGRAVVSREVWEAKDRLITKTAITKSLIEAGRKWGKAVEKEADGWLGWVYKKPKEKSNTETVADALATVMDSYGLQTTEEAEKALAEAFANRKVGKTTPGELPKKKSEENVIEKTKGKDEFDQPNDPNFNRDNLIKRLGKQFATLFVDGKTKGLGLEEWLTKNYEVKSFMGLSDDYLMELDTVFNDMEGEK